MTVGLYPDGRPGEIFFRVTKEGSTVNGLMDSLGISMSMALQHGVPLKDLVRKLAHLRFEPAGATNNPEDPVREVDPRLRCPVARDRVPHARTSGARSASRDRAAENGNGHGRRPATSAKTAAGSQTVKFETKALDSFSGDESGRGGVSEDSPSCHICGGIMVRSGTCYACTVCGATSGCS